MKRMLHVSVLMALVISAVSMALAGAKTVENDAFARTWERTDKAKILRKEAGK